MANLGKKIGKVKGLIGSIKGDGNAFTKQLGFGDFSNKFDQRIKDGLSDLLGGALGIRMSQVPEIDSEVLQANEAQRLARQKAVSVQPRKGNVPGKQITLQYPLNYFAAGEGTGVGVQENTAVKKYKNKGDRDEESWWEGGSENFEATTLNFPNAIHFRTLHRKEQDHSEVSNTKGNKGRGGALIGENKHERGFMQSQRGTEWRDEDVGSWGSVNPAEEVLYDIFLHLPEKVADEVKVEYTEAKAGGLQRFFARLFDTTGNVEKMSGEANMDMNELLTAVKGMLPGGDILQKSVGHMTNPAVFQTLKNVSFRTYTYNFKLMPTSPQEADVIRRIIFAFKKSMLPGSAGENNGIWTLPNEWAINFEGPIKDWVDFPLTAVCTGATVDYGPHLMAGDSAGAGRGSPSAMTLNLSFVETMQLSRQRYAYEVGASGGGRESRAEEGTRLGSLSRVRDEDLQELADNKGIGGDTHDGTTERGP